MKAIPFNVFKINEAALSLNDVFKYDYKYILSLLEKIRDGEKIKLENGNEVFIQWNDKLNTLKHAINNGDQVKIEQIFKNSGGRYNEIFQDDNSENKYKLNDIYKGQFSGVKASSKNVLGKKLADKIEKATYETLLHFIKGKTDITPNDLSDSIWKEDDEFFNEWYNTFIASSNVIKSFIENNSKFNVDRFKIYHDATSKEELVLLFHKISNLSSGNKDSWNPSDIWIVHADKEIEMIERYKKLFSRDVSDDIKLNLLNSQIYKDFEDGILFPISLKKTGGNAKISLNNTPDQKIEYFDFIINRIPDNFDFDKSSNEFVTKEIGTFSFKDLKSNETLDMQVRGFPHGFTTAQTEITGYPSSRGGGRAGKVPARIVDNVLSLYNEKRINSIKHFKDFYLSDYDIKEYVDMYKRISKDGRKIRSFENNIEKWVKLAQKDKDVKATLGIKLQGLVFADIFVRHYNHISDIINKFLLGAKKIDPTSSFYILVN